MNDEAEDAIDRLLRDAAPDPVADDGFCARLAEHLPPRPRRVRWPLASGILAGIATCWLALRSSRIALAGWHDWLAGDLTQPALVLLAAAAGTGLLALAWTLAEAQEQTI